MDIKGFSLDQDSNYKFRKQYPDILKRAVLLHKQYVDKLQISVDNEIIKKPKLKVFPLWEEATRKPDEEIVIKAGSLVTYASKIFLKDKVLDPRWNFAHYIDDAPIRFDLSFRLDGDSLQMGLFYRVFDHEGSFDDAVYLDDCEEADIEAMIKQLYADCLNSFKAAFLKVDIIAFCKQFVEDVLSANKARSYKEGFAPLAKYLGVDKDLIAAINLNGYIQTFEPTNALNLGRLNKNK